MDFDEYSNIYDMEFLGLLMEINKVIGNFSKGDILKIKSWLKVLVIPTKTIELKKRRNMHAIVLLDNMINNKLEAPFTKFAYSQNDLTYIPVEKVKAEISKKFKKKFSSESIELEGRNQKIKMDKENGNISEGQKIFLEEKYLRNNPDINNINLKNQQKQMELDKFKLESIIMGLQDRVNEKDAIIAGQQKEINSIKFKISQLEKKTKIILEHQKRMKLQNK